MNQLNTYGTTTIGADGRATVTLTPTANLDWTVTRMAVKTTQDSLATPIPICTVYLGTTSDGDIVDQTWTGSRDVSDCNVRVQYGSSLIAVWEGGIPGTQATISIIGTQDLRS